MGKKFRERGILEEIFNIDPPEKQWLFPGKDKKTGKFPGRNKKRPWQKNTEECPNCGTMYPAGGSCPGCGLHHDEMMW